MFNIFETILFKIIISVLIGSLIGIQREIRQQKLNTKDFAGFRTFTLISLLGFLFGFISNNILKNNNLILIGISGIILISIFAYRATTKIFPESISSITQITAIITFILGMLISYNETQLSITIAILISIILFLGQSLHKFTKKLKETEIFATLKFAIISLVILPLLPNKNYTLLELPIIGNFFKSQTIISKTLLLQLDVFNFYHIWLVVVFISGLAYIGYILMKIFGAEKGIEFTGFLGGLMSSTALTTSFAIESKRLNYLSQPLIIGTVIACSTMFFRIIFEVAILNPSLLIGITLLLGIMGFVGYISSYYLYKKIKLTHIKEVKFDSPFTLKPAIKFSIIFLFVIFISKLFSIIYGNTGIYFVSFLSGISDVDAITISLSNLASMGQISNFTAQIGILIAAFANTIVKGLIAYYFGSKKFSLGIFKIFSIIIITGIISILFILL